MEALKRLSSWLWVGIVAWLLALMVLLIYGSAHAHAGGGAVLEAGHAALQALQVPYATASPAPSTSAFITLTSATTGQTNAINLADTGGYSFYLSWAPTCAGLSATGQNVTLVAGGSSGTLPLYIPPTACVGAKWIGTAPSLGELDLTFMY